MHPGCQSQASSSPTDSLTCFRETFSATRLCNGLPIPDDTSRSIVSSIPKQTNRFPGQLGRPFWALARLPYSRSKESSGKL